MNRHKLHLGLLSGVVFLMLCVCTLLLINRPSPAATATGYAYHVILMNDASSQGIERKMNEAGEQGWKFERSVNLDTSTYLVFSKQLN